MTFFRHPNVSDAISCSYCDEPATGLNAHSTYFCDYHGDMWMGIVFRDRKWNYSGGLEELVMLTMVAEEANGSGLPSS